NLPGQDGVVEEETTSEPDDLTPVDVPGYGQTAKDNVLDAINALESHSGFQVKYGLKSLVVSNPFAQSSVQEEIKNVAQDKYPELKPKQAFIKYLKDLAGVQEENTSTGDDDIIHFGSNTPKSTIQGYDGGDFSVSDIKEAIGILKAYD